MAKLWIPSRSPIARAARGWPVVRNERPRLSPHGFNTALSPAAKKHVMWAAAPFGSVNLRITATPESIGTGDAGYNITFSEYIKAYYNGNNSSWPWIVDSDFAHNGTLSVYSRFRVTRNGFYQCMHAGDSSGSSRRDYQFRVTDTGYCEFLIFVGGSAYSVTGSTFLVDGQIHNAVGRYDGANIQLWVDGKLDGSVAQTGLLDSDGPRVSIGARVITINSWTNISEQFQGDIYFSAIGDGLESSQFCQNASYDLYNTLFKPANDTPFGIEYESAAVPVLSDVTATDITTSSTVPTANLVLP